MYKCFFFIVKIMGERFEFRILLEDTRSDEDLDRDDRKIYDKKIKACINGYKLQRKWIKSDFFFVTLIILYSIINNSTYNSMYNQAWIKV